MELGELHLWEDVRLMSTDALIIVDMQNDFVPSGALGVKYANEIVEPINRLAERLYNHEFSLH